MPDVSAHHLRPFPNRRHRTAENMAQWEPSARREKERTMENPRTTAIAQTAKTIIKQLERRNMEGYF